MLLRKGLVPGLGLGLALGALIVFAGYQVVAPAGKGAAPVAAAAHVSLADHTAKPKRIETTVQLNMGELYFATAQGEKNPTIRVPAGKTVGIHLHNDGGVVHEILIGRRLKGTEGYEEVLTEKVPTDVFFYYGERKAEVGGARFEELELDAGLRDAWLRLNIPSELKGEWEIGCFVEGHYEGGMHARLIVE